MSTQRLEYTNGKAILGGRASNKTGEITTIPDEIKKLYDDQRNKEYDFPRRSNFSFGDLNDYEILEGYSYYMDYSPLETMQKNMDIMHETSNIDLSGRTETSHKNAMKFNRFKTPVLGDAFSRGFGHVFFTRPDCNIMNYNGNGRYELTKSCANDMIFAEGFRNHKDLLKQLCAPTEYAHDFMPYLSNKAMGFDISNKTLATETYGKNMMGHQVQIGRHAESSKTAGSFSIPYIETRDAEIYALHNYWLRYIAGVYRGRYRPKPANIFNKIIDYACSVYYFVTAEDFETIIYWTKLYGVFPAMTPDSTFEWKADAGPITKPDESIEYSYSWRSDDNDPKIILDFNNNSTCGGLNTDFKYLRTYEPELYALGSTWTGAPFIEQVRMKNGSYEYKLRWRPAS